MLRREAHRQEVLAHQRTRVRIRKNVLLQCVARRSMRVTRAIVGVCFLCVFDHCSMLVDDCSMIVLGSCAARSMVVVCSVARCLLYSDAFYNFSENVMTHIMNFQVCRNVWK